MNKIAVDIVLIPPDDIVQLAIDVNRSLPDTVAENHILGRKTALPHITLLMGLAAREELPEIYQKLTVLAQHFWTLPLKITGITTLKSSDDKMFCWLSIQKTQELQDLHEAVLTEMEPIFTYGDVQKEMFYSPPPVNEVPPFWVEGIAKNNVRSKYSPHITLGWGAPSTTMEPRQFIASKIALGHVGNHGTCRKILWSAVLK